MPSRLHKNASEYFRRSIGFDATGLGAVLWLATVSLMSAQTAYLYRAARSEPACDEWTPLHAGVCAGVYEMNDVFGSVFDFFFMKIYLIKCARTCFSLYIMYAYYSCCY